MSVPETLQSPRVRKVAIAAGVLLILWAFLGFFALPAVLRPVVERRVAEAFHRQATLRGMSINPFALSVTLKGLDVRDRDNTSPFLSFESFYLNVEASSLIRGGPVLSAITLVKPSLSLVRNADGTYNVQDLIEEFGKPKRKDDKPLRFSLNNIHLEGGSVDFDDRPKKTRHTVRDLVVGIPFLSNIPSRVEITTQPVFEARVNGSLFALHGKTKPFSETRETTLDLDLTDVDLPYYLAYAPSDVLSKLTSARLDAKLVFTFTQPVKGDPALVVSGTAALRKVAVELQKEPLLAWERFEVTADAIDVFARKARIRSLRLAGPEVWIRRDKTGDHNIANALAAPSVRKRANPAAAHTPATSGTEPFRVEIAEGLIEAGKVHYDNFAFQFADLKIDVRAIDLVPLEAYILPNLRLTLSKGAASAAGHLAIHEDPAGKASVVYTGNALVANILTVDGSTQLDFLKWETFSATGMRAGYNPLFLEVKQLAAVGLSCDVTIDADGTVNLRKITGAPAPNDDDEDLPTAAGEQPVPAPGPAPSLTPTPANTAPAAPDARLAMPIRIDEITLQGGRIGLADHFVKPNYSATLGDLGGRVTGLSSEDGTIATLDLRGSLANHSPLQVSGTINPLAAATFADVKASFRDIDLPAFTPYAGTYAGYKIASGSLTLEVAYKIQNRKLAASNQLLVNQFDFGDKVESKQATKLPVKFAVSLLKDKNGVIDLDLPIEGSLDDPKFRIGKIVWHVLGNLIAKAATAPFALLGRMFGGKGDELSTVDFPEGLATLDEAAKKKLDALAKALHDRPALKLEATGRFSGDLDREGLRSLRVDRKIKAQKLADLVKKGAAPASVDDVVVEAAERELCLKKAYRKEKFPKPRTTLGLTKDLPATEMEKLMLVNETVVDGDLRQLALARANAVKDYLVGPGASEPARIFVLEPGAQPATPKEKARASRVDFSLK